MRQINNSQVINILYNVTTAIKILFGDLNDQKQKMLYVLKNKNLSTHDNKIIYCSNDHILAQFTLP